ncbi:MAG: sigma-54-dependent Fis family transcriptional regulator [Saprospiraceae bacterium]|nr:sigma-54-dependent Fis family transcriptional regulator [Saprospiraceae bacterium]
MSKDQWIRIFVVEDDPVYQRVVKYLMERDPEHEVHVFSSGQACLDQLSLRPHIISLDYTLPDMTGEEVLSRIKSFDADIGVVILSGQQDIGTAVQLLRKGAFDYITKDKETQDRLQNTIHHLKKQISLEREVRNLKAELVEKYDFGKFLIGQSKPMLEVFRLISKAVRSEITVSIQGESGTGKEVVAKSIHHNSSRQKGPFVALNMSAIPKDLIESELFGFEKGAFTGALARKKGQFELSDGGTLFLDEIAEIDVSLQAKLLRAIQERQFLRIGSESPVSFDARLIVATHKNLAEEVRAGRFREDLYYRLLGLSIKLPPLCERGNDILLLANHFLRQSPQAKGVPVRELSKEAKNKLLSYHYPGNVRELMATIELASVMAEGKFIEPDDITFSNLISAHEFLNDEMTMEAYKNNIIRYYLKKYEGNVQAVAQHLDIGKSTVYRFLQEET